MKIKKGDNVVIIAGKDKGKKGKVVKAFPRDEAVVVEGLNMRKKHVKANRQGKAGQIIEKAMPIHVSNVQFVDPKTGKGTRLGIKIEGGKRQRVAKASGTIV